MTENKNKIPAKAKIHYVDNKAFLEAIRVYRKEMLRCVKDKRPKPKIPNYIGECFYKICTHLSLKFNFVNYTYRDEMVGDALENCVACLDNFDPEKSSNPFGYFSLVSHRAFVRRIQREKKHLYVKYKVTEKYVIEGGEEGTEEGSERGAEDSLDNPYMQKLAVSFEESVDKAKKKRAQKKKVKEEPVKNRVLVK